MVSDRSVTTPADDPVAWLANARDDVRAAAVDWVVRSRLAIRYRVQPLLIPLPPMILPPSPRP